MRPSTSACDARREKTIVMRFTQEEAARLEFLVRAGGYYTIQEAFEAWAKSLDFGKSKWDWNKV
jgi:hypothetical protein